MTQDNLTVEKIVDKDWLIDGSFFIGERYVTGAEIKELLLTTIDTLTKQVESLKGMDKDALVHSIQLLESQLESQKEEIKDLESMLNIISFNAVIGPDAEMDNVTDCYHVPTADIDAIRTKYSLPKEE